MSRSRFLLTVLVGAAILVPSAPASAVRSAAPGSQLWVTRTGGAFSDQPSADAVSPDGRRVFVVGFTSSATESDFTTVALDEPTGVQLWEATYTGPTDGALASSVAVSPDGNRVYVTGSSSTAATSVDYTTIAYDAGTGTQLWLSRYNGPGNADDGAHAIIASPDGTRVFVTGESYSGGAAGFDYATVAYDAATGTQLWASSYNGPSSSTDSAEDVLVKPDGSAVIVSGNSLGPSFFAMATVAYDAINGAQLWASRAQAPKGSTESSMSMTPTGGLVFVAGTAIRNNGDSDIHVVAYVAATGVPLWVGAFGPGIRLALDVAVSPDGNRVYVSGNDSLSGAALARAYQAGTGRILWTSLFQGPAVATGTAIGVSPDGSNVYVTGQIARRSTDYATVAYTSAGAQRWVAFYNGPLRGGDIPTDLAVSPSDGDVIVTGYSAGVGTGWDFATVAYER